MGLRRSNASSRKIPKFGFKNINRIEYKVLNLEKIQELISNKIIKDKLDLDKIYSLGLVKKNSLVKILSKGKISSPIDITAHKFSRKAQKEIESAGGKVNIIKKMGKFIQALINIYKIEELTD